MLRLFEKQVFVDVKAKYLLFGNQKARHGDKMSETWRGIERGAETVSRG